MSTNAPKTSPAGDWMSKITDLFETTDTGLDAVKKQVAADLDKLRKKSTPDTLAANIYLSAEEGFKADLSEIGITAPKDQAPHLATFREAWNKGGMDAKATEIINSPELAAMDAFIGNVANLPALKAVIDAAEPKAKWQVMLANLCAKAGIDSKQAEDAIGPILTSCGLGFLVPKKKTEAATTAEAKPADGKQAAAPEAKEGERKKPKSTLLLGDSINLGQATDNTLQIDGKKEVLAQGSQSTTWLLAEIDRKPDSYFADFENAVVLIGSNDLGGNDSGEVIGNRILATYKRLKEKNPKMKIHGVTIPPVKGNTSGRWGSDFEAADTARLGVNKMIREAKPRLIDKVIDLAAKKKDGGLADDEDPAKLAEDMRAKKSDPVHPNAAKLAEIYQRELEKAA